LISLVLHIPVGIRSQRASNHVHSKKNSYQKNYGGRDGEGEGEGEREMRRRKREALIVTAHTSSWEH
jgi:hypothetical protein